MEHILPLLFIVFFMSITASSSECPGHKPPKRNCSFVIDYKNDVFRKDGKEFYYVSGSFHYFRAPRAYWRARMRTMKKAGLNTLCTYVEWRTHAPTPDRFLFTGDADIEAFIEMAAEEGLLVILRIGPYICAERDFGGFPAWLLTLYPKIRLRTYDKDYLYEVKRYYDVLLPKLVKYLYGNCGPVISIQVENEYGAFFECNMEYRIWLRDLIRSYVQDKAVLFTTDNPDLHTLECGHIPEVYTTIDFGAYRPFSRDEIIAAFGLMRKYSPRGPLVNSEFYPGWLTNWNEPFPVVKTEVILRMMEVLFELKVCFNFYMFFGGTSFGFTNGANLPVGGNYIPETTSYDYDAPMTEAGDPRPVKYSGIQDLIYKLANYRLELPPKSVPKPSPKGKYGKVDMKPVLSIFNTSYFAYKTTFISYKPKTFEEMKFYGAYVLYEVKIPKNFSDPATLRVSNLRDRAFVYLDNKFAGVLSRAQNISNVPLMAPSGKYMKLLVEQQGRINYGNFTLDVKGLIDVPQLSNRNLYNWKMTTLSLDDISWVYKLRASPYEIKPPALYIGEFVLPAPEKPKDTFLDPTNWGKGVAFVNHCNLGCYWPAVGPQVTLYVPGVCLYAYPQKNKVVLFETEFAPANRKSIKFVDRPYIDKQPPAV